MVEPLFLKPVFKEKVWGGTALREQFDYDIPSDHTGECWAISGHKNGPSIVENGPFSGMTIDELWKTHHELFGSAKGDTFPLLTKILDANMDLSVQVHPDDAYAKQHEGELGKTECWYIIDCKEGAELVIGHTAKTKEELTRQIVEGHWEELLHRVKIKPDDFFYVPSGTVHALCEGTLVLETQQSSDTTYRLYDYDRKDSDGKLRELHLQEAIDVTGVPQQVPAVHPLTEEKDGVLITNFIESKYFSVSKWDVKGSASLHMDEPFLLCSVINGAGTLEHKKDTFPIHKGWHFLLPSGFGDFRMNGNMEIIVSHI